MKPILLILMFATSLIAAERPWLVRLENQFYWGETNKIPRALVRDASRTNVTLSITSTNWPRLPKVATVELDISLDSTLTWTKYLIDISSEGTNRVVVPLPLGQPVGNSVRAIRGEIRVHHGFDGLIEVK